MDRILCEFREQKVLLLSVSLCLSDECVGGAVEAVKQSTTDNHQKRYVDFESDYFFNQGDNTTVSSPLLVGMMRHSVVRHGRVYLHYFVCCIVHNDFYLS